MDKFDSLLAKYGVEEVCKLLQLAIPDWIDLQRKAAVFGSVLVPKRHADQAELIAEKVANKLSNKLSGSISEVVDMKEAAKLLGVTVEALRKRVQRNQVPGMIRAGRKIEFNRAKLMGVR